MQLSGLAQLIVRTTQALFVKESKVRKGVTDEVPQQSKPIAA